MHNFSKQDFQNNPSIRLSQAFYESQFHPSMGLYSNMDEKQKAEFLGIVKNSYYDYLNLNDEILEENLHLLEVISTWIQEQQRVSYYSDICNEIVNAHRDLNTNLVSQDDSFVKARIDNQRIIREFDKHQEDTVSMIQTFTESVKKGSRLKF